MKLLAIFALICIFALVVSAVENDKTEAVANVQTGLAAESPLLDREDRAARRHRRRRHRGRRHGRRHRRRRGGRRHGRRHHRRG